MKVSNVLRYILLCLIAVVMIGPLVWLISVSLLPGQNIFDFPNTLRFGNLSLKNYQSVMEFMNFAKYIGNTLIITIINVLMNVVLSCMTAYPLAKLRFKGRNSIFLIMISTMIIPAAAGMIVNYLTVTKLGLINSFWAVIIPSGVTVFNVFLMRQAFITIPDSIRDSGKIDGASELRILFKLIIPMVKPSIAVVILFQFIAEWNSFLWPMIVLNDTDKYPLAAALTLLNGQFSYDFGWVAAGTVISILPIIIVFLFTQKYFVSGISGAIKG